MMSLRPSRTASKLQGQVTAVNRITLEQILAFVHKVVKTKKWSFKQVQLHAQDSWDSIHLVSHTLLMLCYYKTKKWSFKQVQLHAQDSWDSIHLVSHTLLMLCYYNYYSCS